MWCWYYRRRMEDRLGGVLSPRGEARLHRHLEQCPACAEEWRSRQELRALLRSQAAPEASLTARRRVMAAVYADPMSREYRQWGRSWWRRSIVECVVGVALVLLALHLILGRSGTEVVPHRSPEVPVEAAYLPENYLVDLLNDPRTAHLSEGERDMLFGAFLSPSLTGGRGGYPQGGEDPSKDTP